MSQERASPTTESCTKEPRIAPPRSRSGWPRALSLTAVAAALILAGAGCHSNTAETPNPAPVVTVTRPVMRSVKDYLDLTGNTAAFNSVQLVARVEGYLEKVHFVDGAQVKKGALLFTIQQDQYRAQLQQAQAQVSAQKAALAHARIEFARYSGLELKHAATQTEVDQWRYQTQASAAGVIGAQAQVQIARLNLDYTEVRAPFDGWIGRHLVDPGNLVGSMGKQTVLAIIDQIDPLYVYFTINERDLLRIIKMRRSAGLPIAQPVVPAYFGLSNEESFPHSGRLDFASIAVTPTTGTLQVRGIFPNHDHAILPGLFARVRLKSPNPRDALLIPGDAVSFDQQGSYVLVVDKDDVVQRRGVKTGFQVGSMIVVDQGLDASDQVVVQGLLQAIPGRKVKPEQAAASAAPSPSDD